MKPPTSSQRRGQFWPGEHQAGTRLLTTHSCRWATEHHHVLADMQGCSWWVSVAPEMASPLSHLRATWTPYRWRVCHHLAPSVSTLGERLGGTASWTSTLPC